MSNLQKRKEELYREFEGVARPKLVRAGHDGDAYTLLVFETVFQEYHSIRRLSLADNVEILERCVVPPPDEGIDIFFQEASLDDPRFHIVQCKDCELSPVEIREAFQKMRHSMASYLSNAKDIKKNLKKIISETDFDKEYIDVCTYYVAHQGDIDTIRFLKEDERIITGSALNSLREGILAESVPLERFELDSANNFIVNNFVSRVGAEVNPDVPKSLLCNLNSYGLAQLDQKYSQSTLGRNILYGGNLRESLKKTSKTYSGMTATIQNEPDLFLFYNNGITILAEDFDSSNSQKLTLKKFSIINGAQTTSTLGAYLSEAKANGDEQAIEKLRKVLVLTKVYEVNPELKNHESVSERIKIYNNTQTPLSSRDMVSIRPEQHKLQNRYLDEQPPIFINIKKGERIPKKVKLAKHGEVSNEALAQLALCAFFFDPYTVLKKRVQLFDQESKEGVLLNPYYDKLFNPEHGVLFNKSNDELDELLFLNRLHDDTRAAYKRNTTLEISRLSQSKLGVGQSPEAREQEVNAIKRSLDIAQKCLFFNVAAYYKLREKFDNQIAGVGTVRFDHDSYYGEKSFKDSLIERFSDLFFSRTMKVIRENAGGENIYTWLRREESQSIFFSKLLDSFNDELGLAKKYKAFVNDFKIKPAF